MMAAVFAMQGLGQFAAAIVALIVTTAYRESFESVKQASLCNFVCQVAADKCWRIILGLGCVPACLALYFRLTIPETPRFTLDVGRDIERADEDFQMYVSGASRQR